MDSRVPEPVKKMYDLADRKQPTAATSASSHHEPRSQRLSDPDSEASTVSNSLFKSEEKKKPGDIAKGRVLTSLINSEEKKKPGDIAKGSVLTSLFNSNAKKKKPEDTEKSGDSQSLVERLRSMGSNQIRQETEELEPSDKKRRRSQRQDEAVNRAFGVSVEPDELMKPTSCLVCVIVICACVALIVITIYMFFQPKKQ